MLKSYELFGFMSPALANDIVAFAHESDKPVYKATLAAVAQARHVRPVFLEHQPHSQQYAAMVATLARPALDAAAGGLIRAWLLKKQKTMLVDFLDALGIKHEDGVVETLPAEMDDARLKSAVASLLARYPQEAIIVYLNAFNEMNEANWTNLKTMLESDPRLQLGTTKA
jgi:hypothetical protein